MRHLLVPAAVAAIAWAGCAGEPSVPRPPPEKAPAPATTLVFEELPCDPRTGGDHDPVHELRARANRLAIAAPADYLVVKRVTPRETAALAERGTACGGATNRVTCRQALTELERTKAPAPIPCPGSGDCPESMYVLTTYGDTPHLWSSPEAIRLLLGPIDAADDAWLLAQAAEHATPYLCGSPDFSAVRADASGYELRERRYANRCPIELLEIRYRVNRDGAVQRLKSAIVLTDPNCSSSF